MTLMDKARAGKSTPEIKRAAKKEGVAEKVIMERIAAGTLVIPRNNRRKGLESEAVGLGMSTKVNANIGTSRDKCSISDEKKKLAAALEAGTDAVMDLSTGGDIKTIRRAILSECPKPLGTVPVYEMLARNAKKCSEHVYLDVEELFDLIEEQGSDGVDFMTIHAGLTACALERLRKQKRLTGIVSRGGAYMAAWMTTTGNENPMYEHFDRLLKICRKYDITMSLGDGLRPGSIADATDRGMITEMIFLGELAARCSEAGVQAVIEGPGHMPLDQIEMNIKLEKSLCNGAPYYVLGPLVTDVAPGYDHITSAIGGAIAAAAGADFLCYVTPSEHLGLPGPDDVRRGVIAARIAAHAADIVKLGRRDWDRDMSAARKALDWRKQEALALDPGTFKHYKKSQKEKEKKGDSTCTMCGQFCAYQISDEALG